MLNYNSFAVRIQEDDIPGLISTLRVCFYYISAFFYLLDMPPGACRMLTISISPGNKRYASRVYAGKCPPDVAEVFLSRLYIVRGAKTEKTLL